MPSAMHPASCGRSLHVPSAVSVAAAPEASSKGAPSVVRRFAGHASPYEQQRPISSLRHIGSAAALLTTLGIRRPLRSRRPKVALADGKGSAASQDESSSWAVQVLIFLVYLVWQSGMGLYMKGLLSAIKVLPNLKGIPASFFATATQQLVGFLIFMLILLVSRLIGRPYSPKSITPKQFLLVVCLSVCFSANIGLNLMAMSLVPLSLTLIIRACSPLSTAIVQTLVMGKKNNLSGAQWSCLLAGVMCAAVSVIAQSGSPTAEASFAFFFGIGMSVLSLVSGACDFVIKAKLGTDVKLNALETTCYNALPVAVSCLIAGSIISKPVPKTWAAMYTPQMTDLGVFQRILEVNPGVLKWLALSGVLAFGYNTFTTFVIQKMSPATTAFAGNFNKAAAIMFTLIFIEKGGAPGIRGWIVRLAVVGNIISFTAYNIISKRRKRALKEAEVAAAAATSAAASMAGGEEA